MYQKKSKGWTKHLDFTILDELVLQISFIVAYMVRHGVGNPYAGSLYVRMAVCLFVTDIFAILVFSPFKDVLKRGYYRELTATIKHVVIVELISIVYLFTTKTGDQYSRVVAYMTGALFLALSYAGRIAWKHHLRDEMKRSVGRPIVVVTDSSIASAVLERLRNHNYDHFTIAGIALTDCSRPGEMIDGVPVVADRKTIAAYVGHEWIDEVLVVPLKIGESSELLRQLAETGVTVHVSLMNPDLDSLMDGKRIVQRVGGYVVMTTSPNYATAGEIAAKRALDIAGGIVGCLITLILTIFVGPAIAVSSPGPIFFSQYRVGRNGKKFKMYKFRSMYMDAEQRKQELMSGNVIDDGMMFKLEFDPRVIGNKVLPDGTKKTGIGQFIRDTSIDEFPQFFNVLKGDMSLVGTRPPTLDEWDKYELHHRARLSTKPGITGMWQVSGRSTITDFEEVVKLDTEYIENWSIGLDMKILLKTVRVVLRRDGSM